MTFFHRRPRPDFNYSIENLFAEVRRSLPDHITQRVKIARYYSNGFFRRLYLCIEATFHQGDVNHITGDINFIAAFLKKRRTVLTIHDTAFMNHPSLVARRILRFFWLQMPVQRCAIITTVSESTKQELLKHVNVKPEKIVVIPVPLLRGYTPQTKTFNRQKPLILQVGTKANKNVFRLAEALEGLSCKLKIVGDVDEILKAHLERCKIDYVASKNLTNEQMIECYHQCDILAFVSTYEGFGMPIIEANATGRVVVTSNILSMPEVAGNAAELVDPYDTAAIRDGIRKVIFDDRYREQLIDNGFRNAERFNIDRIAGQYATIYHSLFFARE